MAYTDPNEHTSNFTLDDEVEDEDGGLVLVDVPTSLGVPTAALPAVQAPQAPPPLHTMVQDQTAGTYHPDFMFCGSCTSCQEPDPNRVELDEDEKLETYLDDPRDSDIVVMKTKFQLRQPLTNPSHILVIQSLLQPLPGVTKVLVNAAEQSVLVSHDASTSTESILSALDSVGHSAFIQSPNANPGGDSLWVRSQFYVRGICCASEVPAVKGIVKPLSGVSKLQINITSKMVHVQHDMTVITAQQIANRLTREGFPTKIQRDGEATAQAKQQAMHHGRTTLHVVGVLTEQDVPRIQQSLSQIQGVSRIGVNVAEAVIYVDHDVYTVLSTQFADILKPNYDCSVAIAAERAVGDAAATALDQIGRSKYVESTVTLEDFQPHDIKTVEKAISQNFIRAQVRAIYPNVISETVKVEHDPKLVSVLDICNTFSTYGLRATVSVNGADIGLYLPLQEDYPSNQVSYGEEPSLMKIHANVWLSGIFWALSLVSYRDGK
jgi:copper ion binding protein